MTSISDRPAFIAYIDEAGDDGLNTVRPIDPQGSSEWLILGAVVIDSTREPHAINWVQDIATSFKRHQKPGLHFRELNDANKRLVCAKLATLPVRCFAIASNKKNMRGYRNPWAEQFPAKNWFYCWLSRLLLERVTHFVHQRSLRQYGEPRLLQIEYSQRGGLSYPQLSAYFDWLKMKSAADNHFLPLGDLSWDVIDKSLFQVHNHRTRAGLQLADVVASAFFKACDIYQTGKIDTQFAQLLCERMARDPDKRDGMLHGYGVKLMPKWNIAKLEPSQQEIFRYYGYPSRQWWMPSRK